MVLDWLLFRNPACSLLEARIQVQQIRWVASVEMRDELAHVLARGMLDDWHPGESKLWAHWDRYCVLASPRAPTGDASRMRCTDPDDQKFIDLALAHGARWLLSRDRAVLKLARRAQRQGLHILTPIAWAELHAQEALSP